MKFLSRFFASSRQSATSSSGQSVFAGKYGRETPQGCVYDAIVAQARQPHFYAELGVPDTVPGRFDLIVLHSFMVLNRLSEEDETARRFSQDLHDAFFDDMDRSLREMGVGDLSVGKRMKKMAQVFYGRSKAYKEACKLYEQVAGDRAGAGDGGAALQGCLARNVYDGTKEAADSEVAALAAYVLKAMAHLDQQPVAAIVSGKIAFVAPQAGATSGAQKGASDEG